MTDKIGLYSKEEYKRLVENGLTKAQVNNSAGIGSTLGLQQLTSTLTQIIDGIIDTKYYELSGQKLSDFTRIEVGKGAYATDLLQYAVSYVGNVGDGWIEPTSNGIAKDSNSSIQIGSLRIKNHFWRKDYTVTNELVQMGRVNDQTFSIIEENEKARKKQYDLAIQQAHFLGFSDGTAGLLNQPEVTVNTTLMTAPLATMTDAQFQTFLASVGSAYGQNSLYTIQFNRMLIPTSDFVSLGQPFGQFGLSRLQVLEDALKRVAGVDFKIVHSTYNDKANEGGDAARYVFYNDDADNLCAYMPVPYTPMPLFPIGSLDLISQAHAQYIPPYLKRVNSMLYADIQA